MNLKNVLENASFKLAAVFVAFGFTWILVSDEMVMQLSSKNISNFNKLQHYKGLIFVILSALLLFFTSMKLYRKINASLQSREELLQKMDVLNKVTQEGIIDYHFDSDTAFVNEQMKRLLNIDNGVIPNFRSLQIGNIHPSDADRVTQLFTDFIKRKTSTWKAEYRYRASDGSYRDMISRGYILRDEKTDQPVQMIYSLQDVTELREANSKFFEQQIKFRISLSRSILQAQEHERNRWAEELHDNVGQVLTAAKLSLDLLQDEQQENLLIARTSTMVQKALTDIRELSALIKPPSFPDTTLLEALKELTENISRFRNLNFEIEFDEALEKLFSGDQKLLIYRVIQEQLSNVIKYADASLVTIRIESENGQVFILVKDDGKGFDPSTSRTGIGLKNIRSRLQVFSGTMLLDSQPGQGCALQATFSLT